ncbi:MAG: dioxygenase [Gallionellaceae bacterium]|jgi:aromatic ring-opening dioxygenase catalytic subunit (LigB family)|nr:dioxygenase [Gallionellaceae bacterium]
MNAPENLSRPLPTFYIPHGGGPCFFMEWTMGPPDTWEKMANWLRGLAADVGVRPQAILVISAHWESPQITVQKQAQPPLLYDYYGFTPHTYQLKYDAPGNPALAQRIAGLLQDAGMATRIDSERGLDHGVFVPFKLIYPDADIPVVQVSLQAGLDPAAHLAMGRALAPLRQEGVLIVGSGMSYHNMRGFFSGNGVADSRQFDAWLTETVELPDTAARDLRLKQWEQAPAARAAHPREEHLLPLMVVAGAAEADTGRRVFTDQVMNAQVSAYRFG